MNTHISKAEAIAQARADYFEDYEVDEDTEDERPVCPECGEVMAQVAYYDKAGGWMLFWKCACLRPMMKDDGEPMAEIVVYDGYKSRAKKINRIFRKYGIEIYEP